MTNNTHVFIQLETNIGQILNQGCYTAFYGFRALGYPTHLFFTAGELQMKHSSYPNFIPVGGINTIRELIGLLGLKQPEIHSPHVHLPNFIGREIRETTLGEIRSLNFTKPFFIKPLVEDKTFTGYVINSSVDLYRIQKLKDDFQLLLSEKVNFVSEFRVFIINGEIVDCKNYYGNFYLRPKIQILEEAVQQYKYQKSAYSLDFGIDEHGRTLLIEINDAFSIAPYGLEPTKYCKFLRTRWEEIAKQKSPDALSQIT